MRRNQNRIGSIGLALAAMAGCQTMEGGDSGYEQPHGTVAAGWLEVGDFAPPLNFESWVRGKPVATYSNFRVYAVVFWSPTSGPSVEALAHLNRLQRDNEDVIVVGAVATDPPPEDGSLDERRENLERFVASHGDEIDFRIAFDGRMTMRDTWLRAAGQRGIPCVFLIGRDARVAWIGHPDDMDEPLQEALQAGRGWVWSKD